MKILKIVLQIVLALVVIFLIAGALLPKELKVEQEIMINKPTSEVFAYLRSLKNQNEFSVWGTMDPNMEKTFSGDEGEVGSVSYWKGNDDVGEGEQEIKKLVQNKRIDFELRFKKPMEATNSAFLSTDSVGVSKTMVKWGFRGDSPYPMNVISYFMKGMLNNQLSTGLKNLKEIMEKK